MNDSATRALDPLTFPLHGSRLIEASAGTGKTFTLAMLYLRLVLRHGGEAAFSRALLPPEILVVTFTNAATDELRTRIRARLVEAAAVFRHPEEDTDDPLLCALREQTDPAEHAACAHHLDLAAQWMDESAISTIHAWCHHMLKEHAFASGHGFVQNYEDSDRQLLQQCCEDYWRCFYSGLELEELRSICEYWPSPGRLRGALAPLLALAERVAPVSESPREILLRTVQEFKQHLGQLREEWRTQNYPEQLGKLFEEAGKRKEFAANRLNGTNRQKVYDSLRLWMSDPEQLRPSVFEQTGKSWTKMSSAGVDEIWKDPASSPREHPACVALTRLHQALETLPEPRQELLAHALHWVRQRLEREKRRRSEMTHHDLLERLDQALSSPNGERLAQAIRTQFPVVLVDEFQDTDPLQYRIFDAVYHIRSSDPDLGFFMIGDPKQAIYAFRGADIHTYLRARADVGERLYTLTTNYRSSPELIDGVNEIFAHGERDLPQGAFLFRRGADNPVPFLEAQPAQREPAFVLVDGQPLAPLRAVIDAELTGSSAEYRRAMARQAAGDIVRLLTLAQQGRVRVDTEKGPRALASGDIAVLVNNHFEADEIRACLKQLGVASVYLSDNNDVYASLVAGELLVVLRALAHPLDEPLLRQALATRLLGWSLARLDRINRDELFWEAESERLREYARIWRRQGVLPLLYRLISDFDIAARLLHAPGGERDLTDLLHLGELLQMAAQQLDGELALVRYLEMARDAQNDTTPVQQLRLETDAQLVRIVTIYKSKGLEYPLVWLPFLMNYRAVTGRQVPLRVHDEDGRLRVHFQADDAVVEQADQERLGEDLRKLYVALTRARHGVWLGLAPVKDASRSALGRLLELERRPLEEAMQDWPAVETAEPAEEDPPPYRAQAETTLAPPLEPPALRLERWWLASYSSLELGTMAPSQPPGETPEQDTALEERALVPVSEALPARAGTDETGSGLHDLPRGSRYGTFLHGVLQWAAQQSMADGQGGMLHGFCAALADDHARREMLGRRCNLRRLTPWIDALDDWMQDLLGQPWRLRGLPLADGTIPELRLVDLDPQRLQVEMEFWFSGHWVDIQRLDALVRAHVLPGQPRVAVLTERLNGMLKGFIDLVFAHQGRYYLVDWKSNWLGPDDDAYTDAAMDQAILHGRYDLQYSLYLLALHRQLRARLPDYDYDRDIGGVIYCFLRGTRAPGRGLYMDRPPRALIEALDHLFAGTGEHA